MLKAFSKKGDVTSFPMMSVSFYSFAALNCNFDTCLYCGLVAPYIDLMYVLVSKAMSIKPTFSL